MPARAYSISNAPRPDGELVLQVARADGGLTSAWIHDRLAVGESIKISGAYGTFIGDPAVDTPVLCLAAGTGLAPILALTEAALRRRLGEAAFSRAFKRYMGVTPGAARTSKHSSG